LFSKNKIRYGLAVVCLLAAVSGIFAYKEFMRKPADLTKSDAAERLAASDLYALYSNYEDSANKKYLGRVIEITGSVVEIENQQDTLLTIFLGDTLHTGRISCLIEKKQTAAAKNISLGDIIKLKGICTGYLLDVELNRCVIVK
jgi:tRNA_anti-like